MRVLPLENEDVNECWLADRDRFSYEALNGDERLTAPMLKQGGEWQTVDWQTALEYVANGLKQIKAEHGAKQHRRAGEPAQHGRRAVPARQQLMRALGSENIDYRLRHAEFARRRGVRWLGTSIASLSKLQRALVVGSNLRKDHPLFALRVRAGGAQGRAVSVIHDKARRLGHDDRRESAVRRAQWAQALAEWPRPSPRRRASQAPRQGNATDAAKAIAASLLPRRAQGHPAGQRGRAPCEARRCWRWQLDRCADRRDRRLPRPKPPIPWARNWSAHAGAAA